MEDRGVAASPPGHSDEPASGLTAIAGSVPNADRWQASRFARLLRDLGTASAEAHDLHERAAICIDALADTVEDLLYQFAHRTTYNKSAALCTGGLSALEGAFDILGWNDPHRTPDLTCDEPKCWEHATCGWPSGSGYRHTCFKHYERPAQGIVTAKADETHSGSVAKP